MTRTSSRRSWTRTSGTLWVEMWAGPRSKGFAKFKTLQRALGAQQVDMLEEGGMAQIMFRYADADQTVAESIQWQALKNVLQRDLLTFPDFNADADQPNMAAARKAVEEAYPNYTPAAGAATTYFKLAQRGVTHYQRSLTILRSTLRTRRRSKIKASWKGVDRAHKINSRYGPRPDPEIIGAIEEMEDYDATKKQWLKVAPDITPIGADWYEIGQDYLGARRWSHALYGGDNEDGNP